MRKRNYTVTIRMNKEEYNLLQSKVKESGRTQQEVVIKAIADLKIASTEEVEDYDNGFNQKIAYTGGEAWVIRILAIVAIIFILAIMIVMIAEAIKRYKKMWDKISQMFLLGSLSGIAVLGDVIREYLLVNLIVLFVFVNMGIILIRIYLRKKFDCM